MKIILTSLALVSLVTVSACETYNNPFEGRGTKEVIGGGTGAVVGGILGSRVGGGSGQRWATGAGVLLGTFLGSSIGASLDRADRMYLGQANDRAHSAPLGQKITWNNPQSGNSGSIVPLRDGRAANGQYCREYEQTINIGGQSETAKGLACQNPDGTWKIQS